MLGVLKNDPSLAIDLAVLGVLKNDPSLAIDLCKRAKSAILLQPHLSVAFVILYGRLLYLHFM